MGGGGGSGVEEVEGDVGFLFVACHMVGVEQAGGAMGAGVVGSDKRWQHD